MALIKIGDKFKTRAAAHPYAGLVLEVAGFSSIDLNDVENSLVVLSVPKKRNFGEHSTTVSAGWLSDECRKVK